MRKHLSVFGLFARSSIVKVLLILLAMSTAEVVFFNIELQNRLETYEAIGSGMVNLEHVFDLAAINVFFRIALVLITLVLCLPGCSFKSNTSYTLGRLSITERAEFFIQAVYNTLIYVIFIAVQLVVAFVLSELYISSVPTECISNQTVVLAFYRNEFLHSLLPFEDVGIWLRNTLLIILFGLASAEFPYLQRRRKFSSTSIALAIYTIVYFDQGIGELLHVITTSIIALMVIGEVAYTLTRKDKEADPDDQTD